MSQSVLLTIGMIVRNEEQNLPRCLDSLQPLLQSISSELIITDTGSTDRTIEIARQYANQVLQFKWCDDFAAARNVALERARGKWFLYLDADEYFEDTTSIIQFLKSKEAMQYNGAKFKIYNHVGEEGKDCVISENTRLFKYRENMRFIFPIHEVIPCDEPIKQLETVLHHDGYNYHNRPELQEKKHRRNIGLLLKEYEKNPSDLRVITHIIRDYEVNDKEKMLEYIEKAYKMVEKAGDNAYFNSIYIRKVKAHYEKGEYPLALQFAEEYFEYKRNVSLSDLDMLVYMGLAKLYLEAYEASVDCFMKYLKLYEDYETGRLAGAEEKYDVVLFAEKRFYYRVFCFIAEVYKQNKRYEEAFEWLEKIDFEVYDATGDFLALLQTSQAYEKVLHLRKKYIEANIVENKEEIWQMAEELYQSGKCSKAQYLDGLNEISEEQKKIGYYRLNLIRYYDYYSQPEETIKLIQEVLESDFAWTPYYADIILLAIKYKMKGLEVLKRLPIKEQYQYIGNMQRDHEDFDEIVFGYFLEAQEITTLNELGWHIALKEAVLLKNNLSDEKRLIVFESYMHDLVNYMLVVYHPQILNAVDIGHLPAKIQFAYYMKQAEEFKAQGDKSNYLKELNKALISYGVMKPYIKLILEAFEREEEQTSEFAQYVRLIKQKIEELLALGQKQQVKEILRSLEQMIPNDKDVIRYKKHLEM